MHAIVPICSLVGQLCTELNESGNRKRRGEKFVGMLAKAKHQKRSAVHTGAFIETGQVVHSDPLPPGRYWIDIFEKGLPAWVGWSGGNLSTVQVEKTEIYQGTSKVLEALGWIYPWVPADPVVPTRAFVIFNVSAPTDWGVENDIGWPSVAPKGVIETSDDTVQKPKAEDTLPWWQGGNQGGFKSWEPSTKFLVVGGVVLVVAVAASYAIRGFR